MSDTDVAIFTLALFIPVAFLIGAAFGFRLAKLRYEESWEAVTAPPNVGVRESERNFTPDAPNRVRTRPVSPEAEAEPRSDAVMRKAKVRVKNRF